MDRATEVLIVVFYCIALILATCGLPLISRIQVLPFTTPTASGTPSRVTSGTPPTYTPEVTAKTPAALSYSYTTSGYESRTFRIPVEVTDPPFVVSYRFAPKNVTRTKMVTSEYGMKETKVITYEMPSEYSWLRVRILDEQGNVVDEGGYGQIPGEGVGLGNLEGKVATYRQGNYIVEVRFNDMMGKFSF